jgi:hypothetical protein
MDGGVDVGGVDGALSGAKQDLLDISGLELNKTYMMEPDKAAKIIAFTFEYDVLGVPKLTLEIDEQTEEMPLQVFMGRVKTDWSGKPIEIEPGGGAGAAAGKNINEYITGGVSPTLNADEQTRLIAKERALRRMAREQGGDFRSPGAGGGANPSLGHQPHPPPHPRDRVQGGRGGRGVRPHRLRF